MNITLIFLCVTICILFIFLLIFIIVTGNALNDINIRLNNICNSNNNNNDKMINELNEKLTFDEKIIENNKNLISDHDKKIKDINDTIKTTTVSISNNTKMINETESEVKDLKLNNFGLFTLTVINDYSLLQKNKIKTSQIDKEIKDFYNKAKYFNISNIVVVNNIKITTGDNDIKDTDYIYSLSQSNGFIYKTYVSFAALDNLKLDSNKLLTFPTKSGTLYIKNYVFKIPDVVGNEFIFMIITHSTNLYPTNDVLIQSNLISDINTKMGEYLKLFKDPLLVVISTLEQEYTEKFFSAFTFMKAKDYKKIQGDLEVESSNTDIKLYNSIASTKFNSLYESYKKGISIYKLKQPECRSIFLN